MNNKIDGYTLFFIINDEVYDNHYEFDYILNFIQKEYDIKCEIMSRNISSGNLVYSIRDVDTYRTFAIHLLNAEKLEEKTIKRIYAGRTLVKTYACKNVKVTPEKIFELRLIDLLDKTARQKRGVLGLDG